MPLLRPAALAALIYALPLCGQAPSRTPAAEIAVVEALPDAPSWSSSLSVGSSASSSGLRLDEQAQAGPAPAPVGQAPVVAEPVAAHFASLIKPGQTAEQLSAADKFQMGIRRQLTLGVFATTVASAGWAHLNDNRPHYGTDSAGFGERLGAAALKSSSQSIFYFGVYSNLFRQDPRFYVMGPQQPFKKRAIYAATRVIMTRQDSGRSAPNWSLFASVASSAALTNAYYPTRDRAVDRTVFNIFSTLATRIATQELREFGGDIRQRLHLKP